MGYIKDEHETNNWILQSKQISRQCVTLLVTMQVSRQCNCLNRIDTYLPIRNRIK